MGKKKSQEQLAEEWKQEANDWEDYLMFDLQERIKKHKGKPLSERQLKKTTNGDVTYERMVRIIGRGSPERLKQVMMEMVSEKTPKVQVDQEPFEETQSFESETHFEVQERFELEKPLEKVEVETCEDEASREASQLAEKPKRKKWDKASLLVFLRGKCRELGQALTSTQIAEWSKQGLCPSYPTCLKLLKVKTKAELDMVLLGEE